MFNRTFPAPLPAIAFVPSHPVGRPPQQALTSGLLPAGAWSPFGRLCLLILRSHAPYTEGPGKSEQNKKCSGGLDKYYNYSIIVE